MGGPHMPHDIPLTIPAHITLFLYYDSLDGASHYSGSAYTQEADEELFLEGDHTAISELFTFMIYQMNGGQTTHAEFHKLATVIIVVALGIVIGISMVLYASFRIARKWLKKDVYVSVN